MKDVEKKTRWDGHGGWCQLNEVVIQKVMNASGWKLGDGDLCLFVKKRITEAFHDGCVDEAKNCHKHVAEAVAEEREACAKVAELETELDGRIPKKVVEAVESVGLEESLRAVCRGTKKSIAKAIRSRTSTEPRK